MSALGPRADGLRLIRIVIVCLAVGAIINSAGQVYLFAQNSDRARDTRELALTTTYALCALRNDLETRVLTSKQFLVEHPGGIPGVPVRTIRDGIANQERTIAALAGINC